MSGLFMLKLKQASTILKKLNTALLLSFLKT